MHFCELPLCVVRNNDLMNLVNLRKDKIVSSSSLIGQCRGDVFSRQFSFQKTVKVLITGIQLLRVYIDFYI